MYFLSVWIFLLACVMCAICIIDIHRCHKRSVDSLNMNSSELRLELWSSGRAMSVLNYRAIYPALELVPEDSFSEYSENGQQRWANHVTRSEDRSCCTVHNEPMPPGNPWNTTVHKMADQSALADDEMVVSFAVYLVSLRQHLCYYRLI